MPRQMPSTGWVSVGIRVSSPLRRSRVHGIGGRAHAGKDDVSRGADAFAVGRDIRRGTQALQGELERRDVGAAAGDDDDAGRSQNALGARQLGALAPNRLTQAAADALEAGLDHVMSILAAHA